MDLFMEHIVKHKRQTKDYVMIALSILLGLVLLLFSPIILTVQVLASLWLLVVAGIIFLVYVMIKRTDIEFEYILTNKELDIDRITAKSRRKRIFTIDFSVVDICAPVSTHKGELSRQAYKTIDCTGMGESEVYFVDITSETGVTRVLIEPPAEFIENVKRYNPSKIFTA